MKCGRLFSFLGGMGRHLRATSLTRFASSKKAMSEKSSRSPILSIGRYLVLSLKPVQDVLALWALTHARLQVLAPQPGHLYLNAQALHSSHRVSPAPDSPPAPAIEVPAST